MNRKIVSRVEQSGGGVQDREGGGGVRGRGGCEGDGGEEGDRIGGQRLQHLQNTWYR